MKYCHPVDAWIDREVLDLPEIARLRNTEGDKLFDFPAAWTNDQIMIALDFANKAFERGLALGRADKAFEIRKALGMDS
ncbi:MAG: hypothetical protein PHS14_20940 [Elusimicrobia bacterium]|nr:hypothetical protein [Elusimicrobiota bacterium]